MDLNEEIAIGEELFQYMIEDPFPQGRIISLNLPSHAVGNLLEVHDFVSSFLAVEGEEPTSFSDLEKDLLTPFPYGVGKSSILDNFETFIHTLLLPERIRNLVDNTTTGSGIKLNLDMIPINQLTWPEVVRRYIMAYLVIKGRTDSDKIAQQNNSLIFHCLQADGGICSDSVTGVAGVELDTQLLGRAIEKVFGINNLKKESKTAYLCITNVVPDWAKVLEPVRKLPTNVGSRIRNCVREALEKNPPEWAKKLLEASISKDVYKGNASGPTKNAVIGVLNRVSSVQLLEASDVQLETNIERSNLISKIMMNKCRRLLRRVAAYDKNKDVSDLVGRNFNFSNDENIIKLILKSELTRPLDLRTIDLRLVHGAYGGSHEAFCEDMKEVKHSLKLWIELQNRPSLIKLVDNTFKDFNLLYETEVGEYFKYITEGEFTTHELEGILYSIEIPKAPWETGICKVCGMNVDDHMVLLCDSEGCNAEYHTYCLNPPVNEIPQGNWYCPKCAPIEQLVENEPKSGGKISQFVDKDWEETSQFLDLITLMEGTEFWELDADKKIWLLKFLVDESLSTSVVRENLEESRRELVKKFLGIDCCERLYWESLQSSPDCGIVVNGSFTLPKTELPQEMWYLYQSPDEIASLVAYLKTNDPTSKNLRTSISEWPKSVGHISTNLNKSFSQNCLAAKATVLLETTYEEATESVTRKKWWRCDCLEPVFPSRYHCNKCHETFFTIVDFRQHKSSICSPPDMSKIDVPESSSIPLLGDMLNRLKISLLDMEAALPTEAKRPSRAGPEWRSAWCRFVKSAETIYEMVEATLVFETMIKTEYVSNIWWWYWSSVSVAAKISTVSALAFRIYTLDAAIDYQKTTAGEEQLKKRKQVQEKGKEHKKSKGGKEKMDMA